MKLKNDFVTNSSSATFILTIVYQNDNEKDFEEAFDRIIQEYNNHVYSLSDYDHSLNLARYYNPSNIRKVSECTFTIEDWSSMYNYIWDIPGYMKFFILNFVSGELVGLGFESIKLERKDEG